MATTVIVIESDYDPAAEEAHAAGLAAMRRLDELGVKPGDAFLVAPSGYMVRIDKGEIETEAEPQQS